MLSKYIVLTSGLGILVVALLVVALYPSSPDSEDIPEDTSTIGDMPENPPVTEDMPADFVILQERALSAPPDDYDNFVQLPCGGSSFYCDPMWASPRWIAFKAENLSQTQMDTAWQRYLGEQIDELGTHGLSMYIYEHNGSDQLADYIDAGQQTTAEYRLPTYLEIELQSQGQIDNRSVFRVSVAIVGGYQSEAELERVANSIVVAYKLKLAPNMLEELVVYEYGQGDWGSEDLKPYYQSMTPIWRTTTTP